jgi:5'-phosphate synthase pdxT subunit
MIGILALQGAFAEHEACLDRLGFQYTEIRKKEHLSAPLDAIIIPGGESTVMNKLLKDLDMMNILRNMIQEGLPVFGTCAGLILLSKEVDGGESGLSTMDIRTARNAYGRQLGSFSTSGSFCGCEIPMTFIRAPYIESTGPDVEILSKTDGRITAARQGKQLVTAFHPELTDDLTVHRYFLREIAGLTID